MKNLFKISILCAAFLSFTILPTTDCCAAELASVEGNVYLTLLSESPYLDVLTFENGGNGFSMERLEAKLPGTGTYTDLEVIFDAEWTSTDETTTYTLTGISIAGDVILGWGDKTTGSDNETIGFVGISRILFLD